MHLDKGRQLDILPRGCETLEFKIGRGIQVAWAKWRSISLIILLHWQICRLKEWKARHYGWGSYAEGRDIAPTKVYSVSSLDKQIFVFNSTKYVSQNWILFTLGRSVSLSIYAQMLHLICYWALHCFLPPFTSLLTTERLHIFIWILCPLKYSIILWQKMKKGFSSSATKIVKSNGKNAKRYVFTPSRMVS